MQERQFRVVELRVPQSPQIEEIKNFALLESRGQPITEEHLFLAIIREGSAHAVLERHGITLEKVRYHVDHHKAWGARDEQFISLEDFERAEEEEKNRHEREAKAREPKDAQKEFPNKRYTLFERYVKQKGPKSESTITSVPASSTEIEETPKSDEEKKSQEQKRKKQPLIDGEGRVQDILERTEIYASEHGRGGNATPIDLLLVMLEDSQYPTTLILRRIFVEPEAFSIVKMRGIWTADEKRTKYTRAFPQFSTGDVVRTPETSVIPTSIEGLRIELLALLRPENEEKIAIGKAIARAKEKNLTLFEHGMKTVIEEVPEEVKQIPQEKDEISLAMTRIELTLRNDSLDPLTRKKMLQDLVDYVGILQRRYASENGAHPNGSTALRRSS